MAYVFKDDFTEVYDHNKLGLSVSDPIDGTQVILRFEAIKTIAAWYTAYCARLSADDCTCKADSNNSGIDL